MAPNSREESSISHGTKATRWHICVTEPLMMPYCTLKSLQCLERSERESMPTRSSQTGYRRSFQHTRMFSSSHDHAQVSEKSMTQGACKPLERELVFDIDLTDYNDVRPPHILRSDPCLDQNVLQEGWNLQELLELLCRFCQNSHRITWTYSVFIF